MKEYIDLKLILLPDSNFVQYKEVFLKNFSHNSSVSKLSTKRLKTLRLMDFPTMGITDFGLQKGIFKNVVAVLKSLDAERTPEPPSRMVVSNDPNGKQVRSPKLDTTLQKQNTNNTQHHNITTPQSPHITTPHHTTPH